MHPHAVALAGLLCLGALAPPARAAETLRRSLGPALEVLVTPVAGARTFTVRLEADVGFLHEGPSGQGLAAALLATLVHAPSREPNAPPLRVAERVAGLRLTTDLGPASVAVILEGPATALEHALRSTADRLAADAPPRASLEAAAGDPWVGEDATRHAAITPAGDPLETAVRSALGPTAGASAHTSRAQAGRLSPERIGERAAWGRRHARWRVVVAVPEALTGAAMRRAAALLEPAMPRAAPAALPPLPLSDAGAPGAPRNRRDGHHFVLVAWPLAAPVLTHGEAAARDAGLLLLEALLAHGGGVLDQGALSGHGLARTLEVLVRPDAAPVLAVAATSRPENAADLRRLILAEVGRLATEPLPEPTLRGAALAAATALEARWHHGPSRARLLGSLARSGRLTSGRDAERWHVAVHKALSEMSPERFAAFFAQAKGAEGATVVQVPPLRPPAEDRIALDDTLLDRYLRIMVDIRCPAAPGGLELVPLLEKKYGMTAKAYVDVSRAITRRADLMRRLGRDADERCLELAKLRSLASVDEVLRLHEALACGPWQEPDPTRRERRAAALFARHDLDESFYRPLLGMVAEDLDGAARLAAIDARCPGPHSPLRADD